MAKSVKLMTEAELVAERFAIEDETADWSDAVLARMYEIEAEQSRRFAARELKEIEKRAARAFKGATGVAPTSREG